MAPVMAAEVIALFNSRIVWAGILVGAFLRAIIRRYWTPLRDIPGPFLGSFSSLWQVYQLWKGHTEKEIIRLHKKHGRHLQLTDQAQIAI